MIRTYRFRATPGPTIAWTHEPGSLGSAAIARAIVGTAVRELSASPHGHYDIELYFPSDSANGALSEIVYAFNSFGFDVGEILVTDLITSAVEGALLGGIGGGTVGALTKDAGVVLISTLVGSVVGGMFGSLREQVAARHHARLVHGSWRVVQLSSPQTDSPPA